MKKNRFSKLAALTQGAAVVGLGVAAVAACAGNETPVQAPSATTAPADVAPTTAAASPAPVDTTAPATTPTPAPTTGTSAAGDTVKPPADLNAVTTNTSDAGTFKTPAQLNAVTRDADGGAPHRRKPGANALPPK